MEYKRRNVNSYLVRGSLSLRYAAERLLSNGRASERARDEVSGIGESRGKGKDKSPAAVLGTKRGQGPAGEKREIGEKRDGRDPRTAVRAVCILRVRVDSAPLYAVTEASRPICARQGPITCRPRRIRTTTSRAVTANAGAPPRPTQASRCRATQGCRDLFCPAASERAVNTRCVHTQFCPRSKGYRRVLSLVGR